MWRGKGWMAAAALAAWLCIGAAASADLRVVLEDDEGYTTEYLMKNNLMAILHGDGGFHLIDCNAGLFMIVDPASETYWRGTPDELARQLEVDVDEAMSAIEEEIPEELAGLFGALFGGGGGAPDAVRAIRLDSEPVAGYDAERYLVEYRQDGKWRRFEELWVSPALLREVQSEVGACMNAVAYDAMNALMSVFSSGAGFGGLDALAYVSASPEYRAVQEKGFPVRTQTVVEIFGFSVEVTTELTEVSREPLDDEMFTVPAGYLLVDDVWEMPDF